MKASAWLAGFELANEFRVICDAESQRMSAKRFSAFLAARCANERRYSARYIVRA
jgi:hypothetical protein